MFIFNQIQCLVLITIVVLCYLVCLFFGKQDLELNFQCLFFLVFPKYFHLDEHDYLKSTLFYLIVIRRVLQLPEHYMDYKHTHTTHTHTHTRTYTERGKHLTARKQSKANRLILNRKFNTLNKSSRLKQLQTVFDPCWSW